MTSRRGSVDAGHAVVEYDVFVSYHEDDEAWVKGVLIFALTEAGLTYTTEEDFAPGEPIAEAMDRAIGSSTRVMAVLTGSYLGSRHTNLVTLLTAAYGESTESWPLIPVRRDDVELPPRLAMLVPLYMRREDNWDAQIDKLRVFLGASAPLDERPLPSCPYPGMEPFTEDDEIRFFGRDDEIESMLNRLRHAPLLTVIGPSGSGKSSLVLAGLYPRLKTSQLLHPGDWQLIKIRPGDNVYAGLASSLRLPAATDPTELHARLVDLGNQAKLLVVIDQAEEIFTLRDQTPASRRRAGLNDGDQTEPELDPTSKLADTLALLDTAEPVRVVVTIRADYYGLLMASDLWDVAEQTRFDAPPLRGKALRDAIVEPAEGVGVFVEPGLVERIAAHAANEPGLLPFVQETMRMLWDGIQRRYLTLARYEALVISSPQYQRDARGGLYVAMALHADETMRKLTPEDRTVARRILMRLVQFGQGRDNVRRQQTVAALASAAPTGTSLDQVLGHLADHRLVTLGGSDNQDAAGVVPTADLAHEALITGWPQFSEWLQDRRAAEEARRRFEALAEQWQEATAAKGGKRSRAGRARGWIRGEDADRGMTEVELADAERWLRSDAADDVGLDQEPISGLVEHSRTWHASRRRFWRGLALTFVGLVAVAGVAAVFALVAANGAQREAERSTALLLAQASERPPEEQDLAALLALEAVTRLASVENRGALKTALEISPQIVKYLRPHDEPALAVASSSDGRIWATAGAGPTLRIWDADDIDSTIDLVGHEDEVTAVAFSPNGALLASAGRDDTVRIWDLGDVDADPVVLEARDPSSAVAECRAAEEPAFARDVRTVDFSPNGRLLAFSGHNGLIEVYAVGVWEEISAFEGHLCDVMDVRFSPHGAFIASASRDDTVRLWDANTGDELQVLGEPSPERNDEGDIRVVAWRAGARELAYAGNDHWVYLQDLETGDKPVQLGAHTERVFALAFDATGERLVSGAADRVVNVWDPDAGPQAPKSLEGHRGPVRDLAFLPTGEFLTVGQEGFVEMWEAGREVRLGRPLDAVSEPFTVVRFVGDDIVGGTAQGSLVQWSASTGSVTAGPIPLDSTSVLRLSVLDDGSVAAATAGGSLAIWDPQIDDVHIWSASESEIRAVAYLSESGEVVSGDADGVLVWWDPDTGAREDTLALVDCSVLWLAPLPGGDELAVTCNEAGARLIGLSEGRPVGVRPVEGPRTLDGAFTANGHLVGGSSEGEAFVWPPDSELLGEDPMILDVVAGDVRAVAVDDSSQPRIATAADESVYLWDRATGRLLGEPWRIGLRVRSIDFSADGTMLVVVSDQDHQLVLNVDESDWAAAACNLVGRDLTSAEWAQVVGSGEPTASCGS